ncbi:MAG: SDR family oxidoreductase [Chloroflexi bacterium]|nr:SDR family oxidoreductase [Chloroflexota bacterium]
MASTPNPAPWALILGASSGFGGATAVSLARAGYHIAGVHLDRRATLPNAEAVQADIRAAGREAVFFNTNAADPEIRKEILDALAARFAETPGTIRVLMHSLAFGTPLPLIGENKVNQRQMDMTHDVMGHSLVYWSVDLVERGLMVAGGRIFAMTSAGGTRAIRQYGPVSAAKAVLEAHVRQLALELAPMDITVNAIRAGVTDTAAARKIPEYEKLLEFARKSNPHGRNTTPADVAAAITLLSDPRSYWITGNTIGVDGGEDIVVG